MIGRGDDNDGTVDYPRGGEEMVPTITGAKDGEENNPRSSTMKTTTARKKTPA